MTPLFFRDDGCTLHHHDWESRAHVVLRVEDDRRGGFERVRLNADLCDVCLLYSTVGQLYRAAVDPYGTVIHHQAVAE
jgi:hypothetical protein